MLAALVEHLIAWLRLSPPTQLLGWISIAEAPERVVGGSEAGSDVIADVV